jgi:hypothetical protein
MKMQDNKCVVCAGYANSCSPAPVAPYSRWICDECRKAKRMSYQELIQAYSGSLIKDEVIGPYIEKFKKPTLDFFGKSEEDLNLDIKMR